MMPEMAATQEKYLGEIVVGLVTDFENLPGGVSMMIISVMNSMMMT